MKMRERKWKDRKFMLKRLPELDHFVSVAVLHYLWYYLMALLVVAWGMCRLMQMRHVLARASMWAAMFQS
jgi:hypothetical protein